MIECREWSEWPSSFLAVARVEKVKFMLAQLSSNYDIMIFGRGAFLAHSNSCVGQKTSVAAA